MITIHDFEQGSDEWHAARCGLLTASEMKLILTPTLKIADNDKTRAHIYELLAQRITGYTEPHYISDDMLRGHADELDAREIYDDAYAPVSDDMLRGHADELDAREIYDDAYAPVNEVGFVTNDKWGFTLGYSPDGLIGDDGLIEIKSRRQKYQVQTILDNALPDEYALQVQTGLLVTERKWCDFITYSAGLPMFTLRVYPDAAIQAAIIDAATKFEERLATMRARYDAMLADSANRLIPTERKIIEEIVV